MKLETGDNLLPFLEGSPSLKPTIPNKVAQTYRQTETDSSLYSHPPTSSSSYPRTEGEVYVTFT